MKKSEKIVVAIFCLWLIASCCCQIRASDLPTAGDVTDAANAAAGRTVVVSLAVKDNAVVVGKTQFVADATQPEKDAANTAIANFDWSKKPQTQADIDRATIKSYLAKAPKERTQDDKDAALEAALRLLVPQ